MLLLYDISSFFSFTNNTDNSWWASDSWLLFVSWFNRAVLLDHGIYRQLDENFRLKYCELWKALILLDSVKIQHLGEQFGVAKYSKYFPIIFTGRTIDRYIPLIVFHTIIWSQSKKLVTDDYVLYMYVDYVGFYVKWWNNGSFNCRVAFQGNLLHSCLWFIM